MTIKSLLRSNQVVSIWSKMQNHKGEMCYHIQARSGKVVDAIEKSDGQIEICKAHINQYGSPSLLRAPLSLNHLS